MDDAQFMIISSALKELCDNCRGIWRELRLKRQKRENAAQYAAQPPAQYGQLPARERVREFRKADPLTMARVKVAVGDQRELVLGEITAAVFGVAATNSDKRNVSLALRTLGYTKRRGPIQVDGSRPERWKFTGVVTQETLQEVKRKRRGVSRCKACRAGNHAGCLRDSNKDHPVFPYICKCECW